MTKLFVSGTEGRAYQEFRGRDLKDIFPVLFREYFPQTGQRATSPRGCDGWHGRAKER